MTVEWNLFSSNLLIFDDAKGWWFFNLLFYLFILPFLNLFSAPFQTKIIVYIYV
jgi:hypothetical protein